MYNPDESSHLKCYKHHMYSYMVAKGYPTELLLYAALENTQKIEEFVYDRKGYKWEYDSSYLAEEDWFLIGVYAERSKVAFDFDTFVEMAKREIDRDHPVLFFAPRIQVPYFQKVAPVDVNEQGIIDNVHSFLCVATTKKVTQVNFLRRRLVSTCMSRILVFCGKIISCVQKSGLAIPMPCITWMVW
jgi:hypothetical protein